MLWLVDMPSDGQQDTGLLVRPDGWKALDAWDGADLEHRCEMSWPQEEDYRDPGYLPEHESFDLDDAR